jgi:hypothetical protein
MAKPQAVSAKKVAPRMPIVAKKTKPLKSIKEQTKKNPPKKMDVKEQLSLMHSVLGSLRETFNSTFKTHNKISNELTWEEDELTNIEKDYVVGKASHSTLLEEQNKVHMTHVDKMQAQVKWVEAQDALEHAEKMVKKLEVAVSAKKKH